MKSAIKPLIVLLAVLLLSVIIWQAYISWLDQEEQTYRVEVIKAERVHYTWAGLIGEDKYLVFTRLTGTDDIRVFENVDWPPRQKYTSSNLYARISPGDRLTLKTVGYRIPLFSRYENIIEILEDGEAE